MIITENLIYRYDNLIDVSICDNIMNYYNKNYANELNNINQLPWFEGNTIYWRDLKITDISNEIDMCRKSITSAVETSYNVISYPHLTTLVMWKTGKSMAIHKDDGYEIDKKTLHMRKYTAVMYLNDDFSGGETIIMKENSNEIEYTSIPQKGSVVIFKSDDSCLHGVNTITSGNRLTLSMWFSIEEKYLEN
jgi:hypothetical protein